MTSIAFRIAAVLIAASSLAAQGASQPARDTPPAGNIETGKTLYMRMTCYYCHGTVGQGSKDGVRLALIQRSADAFIRYVRRPTGQMPAYTERILSNEQLTDIYAYLRSLPAAKPAKDIPLLDQLKPVK